MSTVVPSVTSLGILASGTALLISTSADTEMTAGFLVKQVQINAGVHDLDPTDSLVVGYAQGDASIGEISVALTTVATNPFDVGEASLVTKKQIIFWETLQYLSSAENTINGMFKIGGGKGIPLGEDNGIVLFAFNAGPAAFTTGATINGLWTLKGVWLGS